MHRALRIILNANVSGHCNIYDITVGGGGTENERCLVVKMQKTRQCMLRPNVE